MYEQPTAIISVLVICIINVCLSWAVNHYRYRHYLQSPATKMPENYSERGNYSMDKGQRDVAALDAKYTKELADAKS